MHIVLDLILLLIVGLTIFSAAKRGLVKTVINAFSLILTAILSLFVSPIFKNTFDFAHEHGEVATYFVVFIISWIIVKIATSLLDKIISALPVIRTINKLGGFLIGVLLGVFRVSIYCIAVGGILALASKFDVEFLKGVSIGDTYILKYFYEYNPLYLLINLVLK